MNKQLWKKAGLRALIGAPIGLAISTVIAILDSWYIGDGKFYAVVPELAADLGSEIGAVTIQMLCSLLYGAAFAGASVIWDTDWSLTKMTAIHFLICSAATFPIAYLLRWMEHSAGGVLIFFGQFLAIYIAIWIASYVRLKRSINALNKKVNHLA
jgi:hypothetical protein